MSATLQSQAAGFVAILDQPFDLDELLGVVMRACGLHCEDEPRV